jgi:hypothetical protein
MNSFQLFISCVNNLIIIVFLIINQVNILKFCVK